MLFPELGPQYYDERYKGLLSRMEAFYSESININQSFWSEADTDLRFYLNDQSLWNDLYGNLPANRARQFCFNRIMRTVNMISGYQRRNRKSTVAIPIENGDNHTADQFSKILMHINRTGGVLETISEAFLGALIGGMNFLQVWMDYREDPVSGTIKVDNLPYNYFLVDPYFKKSDLSDCNELWTRKFLTKREIISLLPAYTDEILGLMPNDYGNAKDGKFQFAAESYNYGYKQLMTYDEFYHRDFRTQKCIVDTQTGETMEWKLNDDDKLRAFLQQHPTLTITEQEIPTHKVAIVVQGKVMYYGPNPMGLDKYPFVPVMSYYHPESPYFPWRIQGVVRGLRDAQYLYNRRRIIELDILESQVTSGFKYKENALVNPMDIFLSGQGRGIALKANAQMTDVEQIQPPQVPPSMIQLSELLAKEVEQISGINEELLGSASDDKAGILSMLRQGAGLTTLQILFDNLDHAQKQVGEIMVELIQTNYTPGKVQKILSGEQPAPQFYNEAFGKYGIVIEEGLNTPTQKQMNFAQLLDLREKGVPIPDTVLIEQSTLQEKKKLTDALEQQQQQQQQMAQQQQQLQMQEIQSKIQLAQARATADQGLGVERLSRVQENQALAQERKAKAHHDEDEALLAKIRALKELENLDVAHIKELINIANLLKSQPVQSGSGQVDRGNTLSS